MEGHRPYSHQKGEKQSDLVMKWNKNRMGNLFKKNQPIIQLMKFKW